MKSEKILRKIASKLPQRIITRRNDEPYLTRNYIMRWKNRFLPNVYLHRFHESDEDSELHNHPWVWSVSFILVGQYDEEYIDNAGIIRRRIMKPGNINFIRQNDFHRVDLLTDKVWTLFIAGPRIDKPRETSWGFWNRNTKEFVYWPEHDRRKKAAVHAPASKLRVVA